MISHERIIRINLAILKTKQEFLNKLCDELSFPSYFGKNLDALDECMRDLGWIEDNKIIIQFTNINKIQDRNNKLYEIIYDSLSFYQDFWRKNKSKKEVIIRF